MKPTMPSQRLLSFGGVVCPPTDLNSLDLVHWLSGMHWFWCHMGVSGAAQVRKREKRKR
jgi:hypothetical protein